MEKTSEIVKASLFEKRKLSEKDISLIIKSMLEKYNISDKINGIEFDKEDKYSEASFGKNNVFYFNMCAMDCSISRHFFEGKSIFNFDEFYLLEQLMIILHEIRHAIQYNCDYKNKELIKKIILDCDISKYPNDLYERYYNLFPIEKDAEVFSIDKTIDILKRCNYFKNSIIKLLYTSYFKTLINGYDIKNLSDGKLREFYLKVLNDEKKYLEYLKEYDSLTLHDKLSYNFPINNGDIKNVILIPQMINADFDPRKTLKKS